MVDTDIKVLCSWCGYDVFIPVSSKLCKCYNCDALKVLDDMSIVPPTDIYAVQETTED